MQRGKSLKDQGKSRTSKQRYEELLKASQSLKDQGKSRTDDNDADGDAGHWSQSLKDQGKSRTFGMPMFYGASVVAIP